MTNPIEKAEDIAEILLNVVSDLDLILLYGGLAQGRGHARSDYDMITISDYKKVKWEFIIDNQPINLWSMTWKDVEDVIMGKDGMLWSIGVSSLAKSVILYYKDEKILDKFNNLKERIPEGGINSLEQIIDNFDSLYGKLWRFQKHIKEKNVLELTFLKWNILEGLNCALSALNKKYFLNNWGKQYQEFGTFKILPIEYVSRTKNFLKSEPNKALEIASELVEDVRILLKQSLESEKNKNKIENIGSEWPGVIEYLNKSKSAEEKKDIFAGLYAACDNAEYYIWGFNLLQNETWNRNSFYSVQEGISNIPRTTAFHIKQLLMSQDLTELRLSTEQLSKLLKNEVLLKSIPLPIALSPEDGKKFIQIKSL